VAESLATITTKVRSLIQDTAGLLAAGDLEGAIREAVERYSRDQPRQVVVDVAGDSVSYDLTLPASWVDGLSRVVTIEYPAGARYPTLLSATGWRLYRTASTTKLRLLDVIPATGQTLRLTYTALHTLDGLDGAAATTIPATHTEAFASLAGALALYRLAARYISEQEATLNIDAVDRQGKTDLARRLADGLMRAYREEIGVSGGEAPALAVVGWRSTLADSGLSRLTHGRRRG
jgi:hypothetical protein